MCLYKATPCRRIYIYIGSRFIHRIFYIRRSNYFNHVDDDEDDDDDDELAIVYPLLYLPYIIFPLQLPRRVEAPLHMSHSISARVSDAAESSPARGADAADSSSTRGFDAADSSPTRRADAAKSSPARGAGATEPSPTRGGAVLQMMHI